MRHLILLCTLFITTISFAQGTPTAITLNPSGALYDRPFSIELERMVGNKVSLAARLSYVQFHRNKWGATRVENETYVADHFSEGMGVGAHARYYPFSTGDLTGWYMGIGADVFRGHFWANSERVRIHNGISTITSTYSKEYTFDYSIPVGYKFEHKRLLLDVSMTYGRNTIRDSMASFYKQIDREPPFFDKFYPMIGIGFKL